MGEETIYIYDHTKSLSKVGISVCAVCRERYSALILITLDATVTVEMTIKQPMG